MVPVCQPKGGEAAGVADVPKGGEPKLRREHVGFARKHGTEDTFLAFYLKEGALVELPNKLAGKIFTQKALLDKAIKNDNRRTEGKEKARCPIVPDAVFAEKRKKLAKFEGFQGLVNAWWATNGPSWADAVASKRIKSAFNMFAGQHAEEATGEDKNLVDRDNNQHFQWFCQTVHRAVVPAQKANSRPVKAERKEYAEKLKALEKATKSAAKEAAGRGAGRARRSGQRRRRRRRRAATTVATAVLVVVIVTSRLQNETTDETLSHNCAFCVFSFLHMFPRLRVTALWLYVTLHYFTLLCSSPAGHTAVIRRFTRMEGCRGRRGRCPQKAI